MYPSSSSSSAPSLIRPSSFSFDSSPSVIVSTPSTLLPPLPQPDLPERTPDTPSYSNYYSNDQYGSFFPSNNGYSAAWPLILSLDMRQQGDSNSCVGTPLPFFQPDFSLQLNPLSQSPFPSSVYQGTTTSLPSMGVPVRRTGGRRPKEMDNLYDQDMDHEEVEKKSKRRLRNKEAAARCRARRLNLMNELQDKVDQLKRESKSKAEEIKNLSEKANRLQSFLRNHDCKVSMDERQKILNNCGVNHNIPLVNTRYMAAPAPQSHRSLPPPSIPPSHIHLSTSTHSHVEQPVENYPAQLRANQPRDSTDWIPQYEQHSTRGSKRGHEEINGGIQYGEQKQPKMELMENREEKTLAQINGNDDMERPNELDRPFKLDMSMGSSGQMGSGTVPLTTPSRDFPGPPTFSSFPLPSFGGSLGGPSNILGQTTGLTPIANVSTMSAFPLGTPLGNNDLKNL
ncbi:hypothetical protein PENTCL1PPCAC_2477 [Pristionchus entomophagus]|uniref:BZIP domain-containing protein n=1 Tax=Pristionchus entomophagus TaxID=358040 RepID=A0AAV5SC83_9BILA|nr:hypothetical protein PENTCL1PPCAC_2477 [Pristionchus entomophagus]